MDPTLNSLAYKNMLEMTARDRTEISLRPALRRLGSLLVALGQKLIDVDRLGVRVEPDHALPSLENEPCV
jgi:hypothetical protein